MKTNYKKALKLVILMMTSILIATASAQIYSYMYIEGSGRITTGGLKWEEGYNFPEGASIQGAYVKNLNFSVPKDSILNITDCLRIVNQDNKPYTFKLEVTAVGGDPGNFTTFDLVVYNSTDVARLSVKATGSTQDITIGASKTLYIRFEIETVMGTESGYFYFTVKLTYW